MFASVGEDNRCNKVSFSVSIQPESSTKLWYPSSAKGRYVRRWQKQKNDKEFGPIESVESKWKKRGAHNGSGVVNDCPVWLPGNDFIFIAIYSNRVALRSVKLRQNDM